MAAVTPQPVGDDLWARLENCPIGPAGEEAVLRDRLARENRWSPAFASRVLEEYRRFCWLACRAGIVATPSEAVDQAWHLHMLHSRDYWQHFCPQVLGTDLHHGPTRGGPEENLRHYRQYAETLRAYEAAFGPSPEDIWPSAARRFGRDVRAIRIDPQDNIVVPRRILRLALAGSVLLCLCALLANLAGLI